MEKVGANVGRRHVTAESHPLVEPRPVVPAGTHTPGRVPSGVVGLPSGPLVLVVARRIAGESWRSAMVAPWARVVRARRRGPCERPRQAGCSHVGHESSSASVSEACLSRLMPSTSCPSSSGRFRAFLSRIPGRTPFACIPPESHRSGRNPTGIPAIWRRPGGKFTATGLCTGRAAGGTAVSPLSLLSGFSSGPFRRAGYCPSNLLQKQFVPFALQKCFVESFVGGNLRASSWLGPGNP